MNDRFHVCFDIVLGHEGGYVDHKNDKGGATNFGVTQKTYDNYRESKGLLKQEVKFISLIEAKEIYYVYWLESKCDHIMAPVDLFVFDCAINSGSGRAIKLLQKALELTADGVFGKMTLLALDHVQPKELAKKYLGEREAFYDRLVANDPTQQAFIKGWKNRLDKLAEHLHD